MELDNLKELWQQQGNEKNTTNLQAMLGKKSNGPIAKMKRNLVIELIIVLITYSVAVVYFFVGFRGLLDSLAWIYFLTGLLFVYYFIRKYRLLNNMECMACEVKSHLTKQVTVLEKYVKFYEIAGTAIIPVFAVYTYWVLMPKLRYMNGRPATGSISSEMLIWIIGTIVLTIMFYFLNRWYVKKLYGNHINRLKLMLAQMED